jgi:predicted lactoylglutathione lyase
MSLLKVPSPPPAVARPIHRRDHGFMYDQGFDDLDGPLWNLVWIAPQA